MRYEWDPGNTCFRKSPQILLHLKMGLEKIKTQVIQQSSPGRSRKSRRNKAALLEQEAKGRCRDTSMEKIQEW